MDNVITITNVRKNDLDFDLSIEGIEDANAKVRFVIKTDKVDFAFPCTRDGAKWSVEIPEMVQLERTMYPFCIEVVCEGYFFEPMKGQVNVVGSADIYASTPTNTAIVPPKPKNIVPAPTVRPQEESIAAIAERMMKKMNKEKKKEPVKEPVTVSAGENKDKKVRNILEGIAGPDLKTKGKKKVAFKKTKRTRS